MNQAFFLSWIAVALTNLIGMVMGGFWPLLTPVLAFAVFPVLDAAMGVTKSDFTPPAKAQARFFTLNLYAYALTQVAIFAAWIVVIATTRPSFGAIVSMALSFGIMSGALGITVSHEMMHKPRALTRSFASLLLLNVNYMHYAIEHMFGHHHRVATPEDPASARYAESFYTFLPHTVVESYRHAWTLETTRLAKRKQKTLSTQNQMLRFAYWQLMLFLALAIFVGPKGVVFHLLQSVVAIVLLEVANYIEHYGLTRAMGSDGKYEKVSELHSWNADHRLSNGLLFALQRHPDHHLHPVRPYQQLQSHSASPQLPFGYPTMAMVALIPPLWRRIMDPRVRNFKKS